LISRRYSTPLITEGYDHGHRGGPSSCLAHTYPYPSLFLPRLTQRSTSITPSPEPEVMITVVPAARLSPDRYVTLLPQEMTARCDRSAESRSAQSSEIDLFSSRPIVFALLYVVVTVHPILLAGNSTQHVNSNVNGQRYIFRENKMLAVTICVRVYIKTTRVLEHGWFAASPQHF
jgi:hypothetical protein